MPKSDTVLAINNRTPGNGAGTIPALVSGGGGGGGVTDHGLLAGLADDDHTQYHNDARGDAKYVPLARTVTAGAGLTNGGALSSNITLDVGAGTLITVGANDVGIAAGANYQFIGTGAGTAAGWRNVSELAGSGLSAATGILAVGAGAGLTVNADDVALTTPGSLTVSSTNSAAGSHTHAVTASADVGTSPAAALLKSTSGGGLTLGSATTNQAASLATFASGFAGSGFRIDYGVTAASRATVETDDLVVRGRMRVYELLIQQIRATNGSLFVSSASRTVEVTNTTNPLWTVNGSQLTFNGANATLSVTHCIISTVQTTGATDNGTNDNRLYHGFLVGDVIRAQRVRWNGSTFAGIIQSNLEVTSVSNLYTYGAILVSGDAPEVGYDYVRLGSTVDTGRQGVVYITSDDSNAPFIDIVDGVSSHAGWNSAGAIKARLGKLSGITDSDFGGTLSGYGLYSTNVYLKGNIYATSGVFSGTVYASAGSFTGAVTATSGSFSGSITSTVGTIGGWALGATSLTAGSGSTRVGLDSGGTNPAFYAGSATPASAPFRVTNAGALTASNVSISAGAVTIDANGVYAAASSSWDITAGFRFLQGGSPAGGLTARYDSVSNLSYSAVLNNMTAEGGSAVKTTADSGLYLQTAAASGKTSQVVISAIRGTTAVGMTLDNTSSVSRLTIRADALQQLHSDTSTYDLWTTKNAGLISAYPKLASSNSFTDSNNFAGTTYFGGLAVVRGTLAFDRANYQQNVLRFNSHASAPSDSNLSDGEFMIYVINGTGGSYELRWRGRRTSGTLAGGVIATV